MATFSAAPNTHNGLTKIRMRPARGVCGMLALRNSWYAPIPDGSGDFLISACDVREVEDLHGWIVVPDAEARP
jgi:hypothetical protein